MSRKLPPPHPRGAPRTPGSGRRRGTPNRRTVQMRELMMSLCDDADYQYRLRADFRRRRVHPTIEALVWGHVIGRPAEKVQLSADVTMKRKLDEDRELFQRLSLPQLEELAAQSQALVDQAMAMVRKNGAAPDPATKHRVSLNDHDGSNASLTSVTLLPPPGGRARTPSLLPPPKTDRLMPDSPDGDEHEGRRQL
jgi:hypothetical protein